MLCSQPLMFDRAANNDEQLVHLERFLEVVERAQLHRLDRTLHRGMRRHHENLWAVTLRHGRGKVPDQVDASHLRHEVVDHQNVEWLLSDEPLGLGAAQRSRRAGRWSRGLPLAPSNASRGATSRYTTL